MLCSPFLLTLGLPDLCSDVGAEAGQITNPIADDCGRVVIDFSPSTEAAAGVTMLVVLFMRQPSQVSACSLSLGLSIMSQCSLQLVFDP